MRQLCKGNVAVVKGAILAGCRAYYGYPITPASEIAESAALYFPQVGGTFLQAESEVAAINMVYGAAAAGVRVMTGSSGPGVSLMQEGMSYLAGTKRLFRHGEGRWPRQLPQYRAGSRIGTGDGRAHHAGI